LVVTANGPGIPIEVPAPTFPNAVDTVRVDPIVLGAPIDLGFNLFDTRIRRPVSGAIVRVFTTIAGRNAAVELASGTTDTRGQVDLYAAPPR
jgi:hypothetical protein